MRSSWVYLAKVLRGKTLEYTLLLIGAGLTVVLSTLGLGSVFAEQSARNITHPVKNEGNNRHGTPEAEVVVPGGSFAGTYVSADDAAEKPSQVIGQIRLPALQMAAPIISGITNSDLLRGAGHVPGSGHAGGLGNMAVAGHRDTYFRPLRKVEVGMIILVSSASGTYRYKVDRTQIVLPEQLQVLDIGDQPQLTLITCYPFDYIGAAPKRFIVFAHLISVEPDA